MSKIYKQNSIAEQACTCSHSDLHDESVRKKYFPAIVSFILLMLGLIFDYSGKIELFSENIRLIWYIIAYLPVAFPVTREALGTIKNKDFFNEFTLMLIATIGAFLIGEYPEGVAVMLFYSIGELFQESAVTKARNNIKALLDTRPETATVFRKDQYQLVAPEEVSIGEIIQVKAGEKIPLDGTLISIKGNFNTSALTGESVPRTIRQGEWALAGMVNLDKVIEIKVEKKYADSSFAKILELVQNATSRKAKAELLIRKFAHIYTPIVFLLALAITIIPYFVVTNYIFADWIYRALVFLVISCPCALVISIPLSYFGGIGAASRNGILFKGSNYLEMITKVNTVVLDKTGTLTEGVFKVRKIVSVMEDKQYLFGYIVALESQSNHPVAKAIIEYFPDIQTISHTIEQVEEMPGYGLKGIVDGHEISIGNSKLMKVNDIKYDTEIDSIQETVVIVAIDGKYAGYITIADKIKDDSLSAIRKLHQLKIRKIVMLSGDKSSIVQEVAESLKIGEAYGDLLPEDKVTHMEQLKSNPANFVAFVGDGINDAPALALSDVSIAMGGMGSDAAIDIADVVIQTDQPSKIPTAIKIAKATRRIVFQNIIFALSVKTAVLLLGALGIATMWGAVFADVGVSLIAILNAVRILKKKF